MGLINSAQFSKCRQYRYTVTREWNTGDSQRVAFIGLNPSTADAETDDPTIRRCIQFAKNWGYSGMIMINLFAYRSTDPKKLISVDDPVGPNNNYWLIKLASEASCTVAAWGGGGDINNRGRNVAVILKRAGIDLKCLGTTKNGQPRHPLYLPYTAKLISLEEHYE